MHYSSASAIAAAAIARGIVADDATVASILSLRRRQESPEPERRPSKKTPARTAETVAALREPGPSVTPDASLWTRTHKLHSKWVFSYQGPMKKNQDPSSWSKGILPIHTIATVQNFWGLFNNILPPSYLEQGGNYYLFREGIEPMWEDKANVLGGKWTVIIKKGTAQSASNVDNFWLFGVLGMIGETLDDGDEVCGATVNMRKHGDRISVWTKTAAKEKEQLQVGMRLKRLLQMPERWKIQYTKHSDSYNSGYSTRTTCYYEV